MPKKPRVVTVIVPGTSSDPEAQELVRSMLPDTMTVLGPRPRP
jgi:hypothetical protein